MSATYSPEFIDRSLLTAQDGVPYTVQHDLTEIVNYDPGLRRTAAFKSSISYMIPSKGYIVYRGHLLDDLLTRATFTEVALLLVNGRFPSSSDLTRFENLLRENSTLPGPFLDMLSSLPQSCDPMIAMSSAIAALPAYKKNGSTIAIEPNSGSEMDDIASILAALPIIGGTSIDHDRGKSMMTEERYADTYLSSVFDWTCGISRRLDSDVERYLKLLNMCLIAHADHGQNCSTTTMRTVASARSSAYAAIAAAISSFAGGYHGGASGRVTPMLLRIQNSEKDVSAWVEEAATGNPQYRLAGFGSPVYKNQSKDPRAIILRNAYEAFCKEESFSDPLYPIACDLVEAAGRHPYFTERGIYPNVDLFNGFCFRALGVPSSLHTGMITLSRATGWLAHWSETLQQGAPIVRPKQVYVGRTMFS